MAACMSHIYQKGVGMDQPYTKSSQGPRRRSKVRGMQQIRNKTNKSSKRELFKGTSSPWEHAMKNTEEEINTRASTCLIRSPQAGCSSGSPLSPLVGIRERCPLFRPTRRPQAAAPAAPFPPSAGESLHVHRWAR